MPAVEAQAIDTANAVQIDSFALEPQSELMVALNILDAVSLSRAILLVPTTVPVRPQPDTGCAAKLTFA